MTEKGDFLTPVLYDYCDSLTCSTLLKRDNSNLQIRKVFYLSHVEHGRWKWTNVFGKINQILDLAT